MGSGTTTFDIHLRYILDDAATRGLGNIEAGARQAAAAHNDLLSAMKAAGVFAAVGFGFREGKKLLIDYSAHMEGLAIRLQTMAQQSGLATSLAEAKTQAAYLNAEFIKFETRAPVTAADITEFSAGIMLAVQQAGGGIDDVVKMTEQGVIAAKAMGEDAHTASRQITEALNGVVNARTRFSGMLIKSQGIDLAHYRAMQGRGRLDTLLNGTGTDAMKQAQEEYKSSWAGVTSTIEGNLQRAFGAAGSGLFDALKVEFAQWNEWLASHQEQTREWAHQVSDALVSSFHIVKDAIAFLVEHKDLLLKIGEVWLATKMGAGIGGRLAGGMGRRIGGGGADADGALSLIGGKAGLQQLLSAQTLLGVTGGFMVGRQISESASGGYSGLSDTLDEFEKWTGEVTNAGAMLPGRLGMVSAGLAGLYDILTLYANNKDLHHKKYIENAAELGAVKQMNERYQAAGGHAKFRANIGTMVDLRNQLGVGPDSYTQNLGTLAPQWADKFREYGNSAVPGVLKAREMGAINQYGDVDPTKVRAWMSARSTNSTAEDETAIQELTQALQDSTRAYKLAEPEKFAELMKKEAEAAKPTGHKPTDKGNVNNITIQRVEVSAKDPGRFVYGLAQLANKALRAPTQAKGGGRRGSR